MAITDDVAGCTYDLGLSLNISYCLRKVISISISKVKGSFAALKSMVYVDYVSKDY